MKKIYRKLRFPFAILCLCVVLYLKCSSTEERTYYVPQTGMYIKTIRKGADDFGYVLFSNDSIMNLSKGIDYVKTSLLVSSIFILNTKDDKDIGLYSNRNNMEVNQVKYKFKRERDHRCSIL